MRRGAARSNEWRRFLVKSSQKKSLSWMSSTLKKWPSDERNYFHYPHPTRCQWNNTKHLSQNLAEKWMDEDENQAYFSAFFSFSSMSLTHSPPSPCLTLSQIGNWGFLHLRSLGIMLFHHHHGWCGSCCCFFIILPLSKIFFLAKKSIASLEFWNAVWMKKKAIFQEVFIFSLKC